MQNYQKMDNTSEDSTDLESYDSSCDMDEAIDDDKLDELNDQSDDTSNEPYSSDISDEEYNLANEEEEAFTVSNAEDDTRCEECNLEFDSTGKLKANPGWANAMATILKSSKPKTKKVLVLSRAKKLSDVKPRKLETETDFDIVPCVDVKPTIQEDFKDVKPTVYKGNAIKEIYMKGRIKPNILDKDREKTLSKIATRGVVQLFNAVRQQQKTIDYELKRAGRSHRKKQKALDKLDKKRYLSKITESAKSIPVDNPDGFKSKMNQNEQHSWKVLREDFMMGSKLKDWDKQENTLEMNDEELHV